MVCRMELSPVAFPLMKALAKSMLEITLPEREVG